VAIVAGIDEAGFGPVLGPLVVSARAFDVPDELVDVSMWDLLAGAVLRSPTRKRTGIAVADSKKLYSRRTGKSLEHLERGVLGFLATRASPPPDLGALLDAVAPQARAHAAGYPWHADCALPLPRSVSAEEIPLAANSLRVAMRQSELSLRNLRAEPVFVGEYNRLVEGTDNKSAALFSVTSRLLDGVWRSASGGLLRIWVDRQGGRTHYLPHLQRIFPGCRFKVIDESETLSAYRISDDRRMAEIVFATEAEDRHLPVALASMLSKLLRELFMEQFNAYWTQQVPGLTPTAGYYTDGNRFFGEIRDAIRQRNLDERLIYRSR